MQLRWQARETPQGSGGLQRGGRLLRVMSERPMLRTFFTVVCVFLLLLWSFFCLFVCLLPFYLMTPHKLAPALHATDLSFSSLVLGFIALKLIRWNSWRWGKMKLMRALTRLNRE